MNADVPPLAASPSTPAGAPVPVLRGDLAVWLLILAELLTFAIFFSLFAIARWREPAVFAAAQSRLTLWTGAVNTLLLIGASACVAQALQSVRSLRPRAAGHWLLGALAAGAGFLGFKAVEYADKARAGFGLETDTFWMFYYLLTGFHALHVSVALVLLALLWGPTRAGRYGPGRCHPLETGAVFWHMVDLLWIVLFPLVYVAR